jgi:hypothetical protein
LLTLLELDNLDEIGNVIDDATGTYIDQNAHEAQSGGFSVGTPNARFL